MHVQDPVRPALHERGAQDAQKARKHNYVNPMLLQQRLDARFKRICSKRLFVCDRMRHAVIFRARERISFRV